GGGALSPCGNGLAVGACARRPNPGVARSAGSERPGDRTRMGGSCRIPRTVEEARMSGGTSEERAEGLVNMFLDDRLKDANEPPGLRKAVIDRIAGRVDDIGKRGWEQI